MFRNGDIIRINDTKENIFNLTGEVIGHNHISDEVAYKIITDNYKGLALHLTKAKNCTLIERNSIKQNLDNK